MSEQILEIVKEWVECLDNGVACVIRPGSQAHLKAREAIKQYETKNQRNQSDSTPKQSVSDQV